MSAPYAGEPAPMFRALSSLGPNYDFSCLGGHWVLLAFLPPPGPERDAAVQLVGQEAAQFDEERLFFGVLPDTRDFEDAPADPPFRWFADPDGELRALYGAIHADGSVKPRWVLVDPSMRLMGATPITDGPRLMTHLARLGRPDDHAGARLHAPVLIAPRIFEPAFCRRLIEVFDRDGGTATGVMQVRDGLTVEVRNDMKRRRDVTVTDPALKAEIRWRIERRLLPEVEKAFQFRTHAVERFIIARYDAADGGYFWPHRDDTTPGTAHRKFAVTLNLNAGAYQGGDLRFPEFGHATCRAPTGGAAVFSCSLLHEAMPVTRGVRYAFLPFLYDEAGARIRSENRHTIVSQSA